MERGGAQAVATSMSHTQVLLFRDQSKPWSFTEGIPGKGLRRWLLRSKGREERLC